MASDAVEFLVLGPLEARVAGKRISLGGPRQRAVLADLVLHAGSVVSTDTLIDDLWAGAPPPTARAVVQNAVSRLRDLVGERAIETQAPGYVLRAEPGAIDGRRFERLVHDARPLPPAERSAALRDALALWRGPPFADLSYESFLQGEIARLDELRLTALEDRIEAEIELGGHDDVIPDAARLAAQHPDRERLCRLLMLAHARAGRQQDALDAYEATRRALDEQWGLEPSPETRALHRMILTQDSAIAPAQPKPAAIGAVRRPVSLLLVEPLVDDDLELEAAGAILQEVRRTVADVVSRHGGALSPESGVELVAAFGADGAHEDDVVRAGRAGVEVREILRGRGVEARLAIGTGRLLVDGSRPVLVGAVVGRTRRALHDAPPDEIQLTTIAARLGGDAFELDADGRLLGVRPGRPRTSVDLASLVGRTEELARLHAAFDRVVENGKPEHVVVVGEAGIGKSRLVTTFADDVPAVVLHAACTPYGEGITFLPLRELATHAAALDEDSPELGDLESADAALAAARMLLEHFAALGPIVLVLDDLHWAVPTFLDLVEYVVRVVDGPLLVVSVTRPELLERRPAWSEGATMLESLAADDARLLVDALPEREVLDDTLATAILDAAEGVPLFLEQLAAHAAESDLADGRIPTSLDALLASRIDVLEPGERAVLSRAAVVGRMFSRESLGALTPDGEARELGGRLASLERRRLVRPRGDEHEFVHPLVRGAAYDAIGRPERAAMHETFARWLDDRGEADELVGTHLERAAKDGGDPAGGAALAHEASARLARAGQRALLSFDHAAAVNLLERAAALLEEQARDRMEIECSLGPALRGVGRLDQAIELLESTVGRARIAGHRTIELRAGVELVPPLVTGGQLTAEEAGALLDEALAVFKEADDVIGVARAELACMNLLFATRHVDSAFAHAERADAAYRRLGRSGQVDVSAASAAMKGSTTVREAIRAVERGLARHLDSPRVRAYLLVYLGFLRALSGAIVEAREASTAARSDLQDLGEEVGLGTSAALDLGETEAIAADWSRAREIFEQGLDYTRDRPQHQDYRAYFLARLGETALERADPHAAASLADEARGLAIPGDVETDVWWRRVAARALSATGQPRKAMRLGREALAIADSTEDVLLRTGARLDLAEVQLRAGRESEARSLVREGLELLDRKGAVLPAEHARARFAKLLGEKGGRGDDRAHRDPTQQLGGH
jgi:DNA-binding SARP family transcriptional activator/tetratricopeptide (TPR) repeat protein